MTEAPVASTEVDAVDNAFVCPECAAAGVDTSFTRASALGVHRSRKHGVAGKTPRKPKAKSSRRPERPTRPAEFDGARLLKIVNNGHPLTPDRLNRMQAWLAEGEALFRGD